MLSIATLGMLVLALAIVFFVIFYQKRVLQFKIQKQKLETDYQQKMLLAALESQEEERKRIAAELHDGVGAMLSTIRLNLANMQRKESVKPEEVGSARQFLDDTIDSVRKISKALMPSTLEKFGFSMACREMAEQYSAISAVPIHYKEDGTPIELENSKALMLFRIVQEAINNSLKHAKPKSIIITLHWSEKLFLSIQDDGVGFDIVSLKQSGRGLGLFTMENRAKLLNGVFQFDSKPGAGTIIQLEVAA